MFKHKPWLLTGAFLLIFGSIQQAGQASFGPTVGIASYYGPTFHGKCCTANGETVNMYAHTAAHPTLPFGTQLKVTHLKNNKSVIVRVNDRGPYHGNRIIDLSKGAFEQIARQERGVIKVKLEIIKAKKSSATKAVKQGHASLPELPRMTTPGVRP